MKLNNNQREFCRLIAEESYKASTAYRKVYGSTMSPNVSNAAAYRLLQKEEIKRYLATIQAEIRDKYSIDKAGIIKNHIKLLGWFDEMRELGSKEKLNKNEEARFKRLSTLLKGSDYNKTQDMLAKLTGAYEPEQVEIKQEWNFTFTDNDNDGDTDN